MFFMANFTGIVGENCFADINKTTSSISEKLAHDLRYKDDTDTISLAVMDNSRVMTAHKDLNIICWNIEQGL